MRIDPKYFNTFLAVCAGIAALLIVFFMLDNRENERQAFRERITASDSLQSVYWTEISASDSLRITEFEGDFVILNFWSNWSGEAEIAHLQLARLKKEFPDTLEVIVAAVGQKREEVRKYIRQHQFPFHFVAGSRHFSDFHVPGLPAQLIFSPEGRLWDVFLGYSNQLSHDSLRAMINRDDER